MDLPSQTTSDWDLCRAPDIHAAHRGQWAAMGLPFVIGVFWVLALAGSIAA